MKTVVLGVTGCIAAYKALEVVSGLKKLGYGVKIIMTASATEFVTPLSFETLSANEVVLGMFDKKKKFDVEHVSLAKQADAFVIVPATANIIAKIAQGVADDMLSTTALAMPPTVKRIIAPAMNTVMFENEATFDNLSILAKRGWKIVEPSVGRLACGDVGKGHIAEVEDIVAAIDNALTPSPDLRGKRVLVTMGGTEENIDPVRVITNHSSGKMGLAIVNAVLARGGIPVVVCGKVKVALPKGIEVAEVRTTLEMQQKVNEKFAEADIIVMAAAPSDYRVKNIASEKIKGENLTLELVKNPDIAKEIGEKKGNRKLVIFAAETTDLSAHAKDKLVKKQADLVVANDVTKEGAGFGTDTNIATLITPDGRQKETGLVSKSSLANTIIDVVLYGL